jgi:hypothetical protein
VNTSLSLQRVTGRPAIRQETGRGYKGLDSGLNLAAAATRNFPFLIPGKFLTIPQRQADLAGTQATLTIVPVYAPERIHHLAGVLRLHPAGRERDELGHGPKFELFFDLGPVRFNGFRTQVEVSGDFYGALAAPDKFENLEFPVT